MKIEAWGKKCNRQELMAFYLEAFDNAYEDLTMYIAWTGPKRQGDDDEREDLTEHSPKRTHMYVNRNGSDDNDVEVWMRSEYDSFHENVRGLLKKHGFTMVQSIW